MVEREIKITLFQKVKRITFKASTSGQSKRFQEVNIFGRDRKRDTLLVVLRFNRDAT